MVLETVKFIKRVFGNPIVRATVKYLSNKKVEDKSLLYHALSIYSGEEAPRKFTPYLSSLLLSFIIDFSAHILDVKSESTRKFFKERGVRRGIETILRSIGKYGITIPQMLDAPFLVVWNFTNACNLKCKHCYQRAEKPLPNELSLEEKFKVLDQLEEAGVAAIAFSGGEPLIHQDFWPVVERAVRKNFYVAVATNGTLITERVAEKLKTKGVNYVEISIDSADPEKHDMFRGVKGSWKSAVRGIRNCVKRGLFTGIATTVTKYNYLEAKKIIGLARRLGVSRVIFFNFIPVGRGEKIVEMDLTPTEREAFLSMLYEELKVGDIEILSTAPQYARVVLEKSGGTMMSPTHFYAGPSISGLSDLANFIGGCGAGRIYCALQPDGTITPCVFIPQLPLGNIREKSFSEIWENTPILKAFRSKDILQANCGKCPYRYICGGCRARALSYYGYILAPDPGCIRNIKYWRTMVKAKKPSKSSLKSKVKRYHAK